MANELNGLIPTVYAALDIVSRELTGMLRAVNRDATASAAAKGQIIRVPVTRKRGTVDIVEGIPPTGSGEDFTYVQMAITKSKTADPIVWTGEEQLSVGGSGYGLPRSFRFASFPRQTSATFCQTWPCYASPYSGWQTVIYSRNVMRNCAKVIQYIEVKIPFREKSA